MLFVVVQKPADNSTVRSHDNTMSGRASLSQLEAKCDQLRQKCDMYEKEVERLSSKNKRVIEEVDLYDLVHCFTTYVAVILIIAENK